VEIGSSLAKVGTLYKIKILGVYAMVDSGELDWKVIAINLGDPLAAKINSIEDVEEVMPGELVKIMEWFRDYKTVNGNPVNRFALNGVCMGATYARDVIRETHLLWKKEFLKKMITG
jgi:inorganic pyrophosphatase